MNKEKIYILEDRGIIYINGEDAFAYLQNIISNDLNKVTGKYFFNKKEIKSSKNSYDNEIADKVWDLSLDYHNN